MTRLLGLVLMLASVSAGSDTGVVSFQSAGTLRRSSISEPFALMSEQVSLTGELLFPEGTGPFPAVILVHGCGGNQNVEPTWGPFLRQAGYATFNVDSMRGRGLSEVCTQPSALTPLQRVPDAYGALRHLAASPKIDLKRVALMGFSHGGIVTMLASTVWAKENFARDGLPSFRAFISFYPYCNTVFPERDRVSAPVRIHTGAADDWTPARPCADLAASLKSSGHDVSIDVYPKAEHSFDQARRYFYLHDVVNPAACTPQAPSILGPAAPGSFGTCLKKGATVGPSSSALDQAQKNVRSQLQELLRQ